MKKTIPILRLLLSAPFMVLGVMCFKMGELIANDKWTWRSDEVRDIIFKSGIARCSECGHEGIIGDVLTKNSILFKPGTTRNIKGMEIIDEVSDVNEEVYGKTKDQN